MTFGEGRMGHERRENIPKSIRKLGTFRIGGRLDNFDAAGAFGDA
jgi:hypothetical protein